MRWVMYRRPLAGVFEFEFCANGENERKRQLRRPEASGTNGNGKKNEAACEASIWKPSRVFTLAQAGMPVLLKTSDKCHLACQTLV